MLRGCSLQGELAIHDPRMVCRFLRIGSCRWQRLQWGSSGRSRNRVKRERKQESVEVCVLYAGCVQIAACWRVVRTLRVESSSCCCTLASGHGLALRGVFALFD